MRGGDRGAGHPRRCDPHAAHAARQVRWDRHDARDSATRS
jgi:hypothetical protein